MPHPTLFQTLGDRVFVFLNNVVRVRVWIADGKPQTRVHGNFIRKYSPEKLRDILVELNPQGDGVVDFSNTTARNWKITVTGPIGDDGFAQRLRNVVVNSLP